MGLGPNPPNRSGSKYPNSVITICPWRSHFPWVCFLILQENQIHTFPELLRIRENIFIPQYLIQKHLIISNFNNNNNKQSYIKLWKSTSILLYILNKGSKSRHYANNQFLVMGSKWNFTRLRISFTSLFSYILSYFLIMF